MQILTVLGIYISLQNRIHSKLSENFRVRFFWNSVSMYETKLKNRGEIPTNPFWTSLYVMLLISETLVLSSLQQGLWYLAFCHLFNIPSLNRAVKLIALEHLKWKANLCARKTLISGTYQEKYTCRVGKCAHSSRHLYELGYFIFLW